MTERKMVAPRSLELFEAKYLILINFWAYLISRIFGSRISRVLIFAIAKKKKNWEKASKISRFCLCFYPEQRALVTNQWNICISKQDCKLTTALHRILWTRQNITACCVSCLCNVFHTVQCLKHNLRCSVSAHSSKNTRTQNIFKILIVLFSKMVLNFSCLIFAQSFVCAY